MKGRRDPPARRCESKSEKLPENICGRIWVKRTPMSLHEKKLATTACFSVSWCNGDKKILRKDLHPSKHCWLSWQVLPFMQPGWIPRYIQLERADLQHKLNAGSRICKMVVATLYRVRRCNLSILASLVSTFSTFPASLIVFRVASPDYAIASYDASLSDIFRRLYIRVVSFKKKSEISRNWYIPFVLSVWKFSSRGLQINPRSIERIDQRFGVMIDRETSGWER